MGEIKLINNKFENCGKNCIHIEKKTFFSLIGKVKNIFGLN